MIQEPRKAQNTRKINDLETTDHTDYTEMPRRWADNIPKDFMVKQNVDHEWCKLLRLLGGFPATARSFPWVMTHGYVMSPRRGSIWYVTFPRVVTRGCNMSPLCGSVVCHRDVVL